MDSYVLGQDKPKYDTLTAFETEYHVVLACSMPFFFFHIFLSIIWNLHEAFSGTYYLFNTEI